MRTGSLTLALAAAFLFVSVSSATLVQDTADVIKISDMIKGGKDADAKAAAAKLAKKFGSPDELMALFRARDKGGIGWSRMSIGKTKLEDGLEKKVQLIADKKIGDMAKEGPAAEQGAYDLAAMAELIRHTSPAGKKKGKDWDMLVDQMRDGSMDLAKAAKGKDMAGMVKAAAKINSSCNGCHAKYK